MIRSLKALYHLVIAIGATIWFRFPSRKLTIVAVTGTDGKTTTASLIYEILKSNGFKTSVITTVHAVIAGRSYDTGFHVTTPSAYWVQKYLREAVNHRDTHVVLEATSHAISQHRVWGITFAVAVLTNITHEHLDWHKTFKNYLSTKVKLLLQANIAIINRDDSSFTEVKKALGTHKIITYGIHNDAEISPTSFPFQTTLPGAFNRSNCLAAIAASRKVGVPDTVIRQSLLTFRGVVGRMEILIKTPFKVIVDFAHTPNAIKEVLKTVRQTTKKRLIHVFGSAGLRDHSKRPLMGKASSTYADIIILTEEDYRSEDVDEIMSQIAAGIDPQKKMYRFADRAAAIKFAIGLALPGDTVIITGKGHEKSLCRGNTEYPWSDQDEVKKVVAGL